MGRVQSYILGGLGLIPFVVIVISCFLSPPDVEIYSLLIYIYIAYAAIISSFLGGIQWGLIISHAEKVYSTFLPLVVSVLPPLIAWASLLTIQNLHISLLIVSLSYVVSILHDCYLHYLEKITSSWFILMKLILSISVILLTSILYIFV